jgi:hypothetical protein
MARDAMLATAARLVALCREGREAEGLATLYAADCVSVEATPGPEAEARGLEAIRAKHAWFEGAHALEEATVEGPFPHGEDRFAVIFGMTITDRASGVRSSMREVAVYSVDEAGRIVREEFFYGA